VKAIAAGYEHTVALKEDGTVIAWGWNNQGQTDVPAGLTGVKAIAAGHFHTVALKEDGTVAAWGYNHDGQTDVPAGLTEVKAIAAGGSHIVALKEDGTVVAWGWNGDGQTTVPAGLTGVKVIAAGGWGHTVALKEDGTVVAWGLNDYGQTDVPAGLTGVKAIAAGEAHTVALLGSEGCADPDYLEYNPNVTVHLQDSCKTDVEFNINKSENPDFQYSPFNNSITVTIPNSTAMKSLSIYTLKGTLIKEFKTSRNSITWNTKESGVYYIRAVVGGESFVSKVML
jgi:alpha-tubulin suppressor-like RCC1 family protein